MSDMITNRIKFSLIHRQVGNTGNVATDCIILHALHLAQDNMRAFIGLSEVELSKHQPFLQQRKDCTVYEELSD